MNPTPVARKKEWRPTHEMTTYEYNHAIDTLDMLVEYNVIQLAEFEKYMNRMSKMLKEEE